MLSADVLWLQTRLESWEEAFSGDKDSVSIVWIQLLLKVSQSLNDKLNITNISISEEPQ